MAGRGGGSATNLKPVGGFMREAEKEETMGGGGRGNDDNTNNGCYGETTLGIGKRRGGMLGQSGTKKGDDIWKMAVWRGNNNHREQKAS